MTIPLVETGFEDAEVYERADLPSAPLHPNLTANQIAALAREKAMDVRTEEVVLRSAGITKGQFETFVIVNPLYKRAYETFVMEWESALSTNKRIAIEAAAALEDSLPYLGLRMIDDKEQLNQVVEAAKLFAKLAGAGEVKEGPAAGERYVINITTGSDQQTITKTIEAVPVAQETAPISIPDLSAREKNSVPVQHEPAGTSKDEGIR
jgi:hypothetical protein